MPTFVPTMRAVALARRHARTAPGRAMSALAPPSLAEIEAAGNATIGLEILEDLPEVDARPVPYGGGGLACGIATALRARGSRVRVLAVEVASAAPLAAALRAGRPVPVEARSSFVDGIGASAVLDEMWPLVRTLVAGSIVASLEEVVAAVRLVATRAHLVAEGAGASLVAAALCAEPELEGEVECVVSGGNIDAARLERIPAGGVPA